MAGQIVPAAARAAGARAARSEPFEWLARAGFAARGVIYLIVGVLSLELALGVGGTTTNQQGALRTIARQSFGTVMLAIVAVALFGYALWRLAQPHSAAGPSPLTGASSAWARSVAASSTPRSACSRSRSSSAPPRAREGRRRPRTECSAGPAESCLSRSPES